jgi:diguanylate cyclase (GGDEF)-like protein/PAS domain S-box-containing protein
MAMNKSGAITRRYLLFVVFPLLGLCTLLWFWFLHPTEIDWRSEDSLYLTGVCFFLYLFWKLNRSRFSVFFALGSTLIALGFWCNFLSVVTSTSVWVLGMSLHNLFFIPGAISLFPSAYLHLQQEEKTRQELQYTRNLLTFLLRYIPDHLYIKDRQSRFVDASSSLAEHFNLKSVQELLGKTDFDFFAEPHAREAFEDEQHIMVTGTPVIGKEEKETWPDGRENWVSTTKIPWKNEQGEIIGIIGISRDITPFVEQKLALEKNERFLSAIFESVQDGLCVLDRDMNIVRANRFIEEMYPDERPLPGKKCYQAFYGKNLPCPDCPTLEALQTGEKHIKTVPYVRKGEQIGWLEVISHPLKDENGVIQGVIEQVRNVTERIRYEEEIKTREENFRLLAEANPAAILIYQDNRFIYANTEAERLTGYSKKELVGMPVTHFIHPDFRSIVAERAERRQKNLPVEKQYEIKIVTRRGEERWLFLSAETIFYRGRWAGLVSALDITEKKKTEWQTLHLKTVLESIRNVNQVLAREKDMATLLEKSCQAMTENGAYQSALILLSRQANARLFHAGINPETLREWVTFLESQESPLSGKLTVFSSTSFLHPGEHLFVVSIRYGDNHFGFLTAVLPQEFAQSTEEQELFLELSDDLAFGLHNLKLQEAQEILQQNLEESERRFRNLVENLPLGVTIFQGGQFVYANPFADRWLDRFADSLCHFLEKRLLSTHPHADSNLFSIEDEVVLRNEDGEERWFFIRGRTMTYKDRQSLILFLLDVTEKKKNEKAVEYLASHDTLTGLYNRGFFDETLRKIDREENLPISIIMGDLNGLKLVNDAFGHEEGDRLLCEAASLLRNACPPEGILARYGGDEFIMLLPQTGHGKTQKIVERIYDSFHRQTRHPIPVSISLGFGTKNDPSQSIGDIVQIAENWMYQRKLTDGLSFRVQTLRFLQKTLREVAYEVEEHSRRIKKWALWMAESLHLSETEKDTLALLAEFHDVGKITIPQIILQKPDPLSEEEWKLVRRHPEAGFRIAQAIPDLAPLAHLVLAHHEWYNGEGYPRRLKGEEIPLLARLVAVCDAFDVMVSGRPYKKALSVDEAIAELRRCSGTQFDPQMVETFITILNSKGL